MEAIGLRRSNEDHEEGLVVDIEADRVESKVGNGNKNPMNYNIKPPSSNKDDELTCVKKNNELELAKAEMCEVRQENERLKMYLDKLVMEYQSLKTKFHDIVRDQDQKMEAEDPGFVTLSLGRSNSGEVLKSGHDYNYKQKNRNEVAANFYSKDEEDDHLVKLGLDCKNHDHDGGVSFAKPINPCIENNNNNNNNSSEEAVAEAWSSKTSPKTARSSGDDEGSVQQNPAKKARVSVRVKCDTPTMNDGCQWRKYGQKIAKGNPCPRAYYRCTVAPSCPVRKQVQRCSQDMSILISTYEGTHSHPIPISATAMASTTSAAAVMLLSGSSSTTSEPTPSATAVAAQQLHGLNFYLSKPNPPYYLFNPSNTSSPSCPTITLDLANNTSSSSSSHFNQLSTANYPQKYHNLSSSTNLNFESTTSPISWSYANSSHQSPYNQIMRSLNFGSAQQHQENSYTSSLLQRNPDIASTVQQSLQPQSIEAATKAITSDPSFQSALAAALTSIIGTNNNDTHNMKSMNSQPSSLSFSLPALPLPNSKTNSSTSSR